jgi:hypothetical protein
MLLGDVPASDSFDGLSYWGEHFPGRELAPWLIYGGTGRQDRSRATVLPWQDLAPLLGKLA